MGGHRITNPRPLFTAALGLITGIGFWRLFPEGTAFFALLPAAAAGLTLLSALRRRAWLALFFLFLLAGLVRMRAAAPPEFEPRKGTLTGVICESPAAVRGGWCLSLRDAELNGRPVPGRVEMTVRSGGLSYGLRLRVEGTLLPVSRTDNYRLYRRAAARFTVSGDPVPLDSRPDPYGWMLALRGRLSAACARLFPRHGGVAAAMLLGDKSAVTGEESDALYDSGIGHLIAVSGLHTGVLAGAVSLLIPRRRLWLRFCLLALFLAFYAVLTALSPSVLRAGILLLTAELAVPLRRRYDGLSGLSFAAVLILLFRPAALFYPGFQLSFAAVYGLVLLAPVLVRLLPASLGDLGRTLAYSAAASVSILPVTLRFFGRASALSLPANMLALPLAPLFLIPGAAALLLGIILPSVGRAAAFFPDLVLGALFAIGKVFSSGVLSLSAPSLPLLLLFYAGLFLVSDPCLLPGRIKYPCSAAAILCCALRLTF